MKQEQPTETDWKIPISFTIERSILTELDKERGSMPRSEYIRQIIKNRNGKKG